MIIAFEGGDQAGKQTQATLLHKSIQNSVLFDFPDYSTSTGVELRRMLDSGNVEPNEFHSLMADNMSESHDALELALSSGRVCVMNRYVHSNLIYGMAHGLRRGWLESINDMPLPDIVVLMDVSRDVSRHRKAVQDSIEKNDKLQDAVRELYLLEALDNFWIVVKAERGVEEIQKYIRLTLEARKEGSVSFI